MLNLITQQMKTSLFEKKQLNASTGLTIDYQRWFK